MQLCYCFNILLQYDESFNMRTEYGIKSGATSIVIYIKGQSQQMLCGYNLKKIPLAE